MELNVDDNVAGLLGVHQETPQHQNWVDTDRSTQRNYRDDGV